MGHFTGIRKYFTGLRVLAPHVAHYYGAFL